MKPKVAVDLLGTYRDEWDKNYREVSKIDRWYRDKLKDSEKPALPPKYQREYQELRDRAQGQWLRLAVRVVAQALYVEGYRAIETSDNAPAWRAWQVNRFDARQIGVHRAALAHGSSYVTVLPGTFNGEPMPVLRPVSARRMMVLYDDPFHDEWPIYAIQGEKQRPKDDPGRTTNLPMRFHVWDHEAVYTIDFDGYSKYTFIEFSDHPNGVCPVVRYSAGLDLDGLAEGEVEPYINMASRINQTVFDRLAVQRWGSFIVRWITGIELPDDDGDMAALKKKLAVEDILTAEDPETRFGSLPATPLDGYIRAAEADIRQFAAVTQTPPHALLGDMVNMSADALAAAEMGLTRKVAEYKHGFGESHEQTLRQVAFLQGDEPDIEAEVVWADLESRSLAQVADALGKMASMLKVPPQALWERIPGVTQKDAERWAELAGEGDELVAMFQRLAAGAEPATPEV